MEELAPSSPPSIAFVVPTLDGLPFPYPPSPWDERDVALLNHPYQVPECDLSPFQLQLRVSPPPNPPPTFVMLSSGGAEKLAEYNGQKFKYNDLVDIIMGTGHGVVGKKCEPLKARFKGVVESVRGPEFLCRPLVGSSRGPCPQYPRHSVFRLQAFGACVLGSREPRCFSKMKPVMQERSIPTMSLSLVLT